MRVDRRAVDQREQGRAGVFGERRENPLPQAAFAPAVVAIEHGRI